MNLPGYDAWKLDTPPGYDMSAAEEAALQAHDRAQQDHLRAQLSGVLQDARGDIYLAAIRRIVIEELNTLQPQAGEPEWQTKTPVPIPVLG